MPKRWIDGTKNNIAKQNPKTFNCKTRPKKYEGRHLDYSTISTDTIYIPQLNSSKPYEVDKNIKKNFLIPYYDGIHRNKQS